MAEINRYEELALMRVTLVKIKNRSDKSALYFDGVRVLRANETIEVEDALSAVMNSGEELSVIESMEMDFSPEEWNAHNNEFPDYLEEFDEWEGKSVV